MLLQEFDFEVKYRKGMQNQDANHLSRLEVEVMRELGEKVETDDAFLDEHVLAASQDLIPWFAYFASYLESDVVPSGFTSYQRKKFMHDVKRFFWDDPYLYKSCGDGMILLCVPEVEMLNVLKACHSSPLGQHHSGIRTAHKILQSGFYWPTIQ